MLLGDLLMKSLMWIVLLLPVFACETPGIETVPDGGTEGSGSVSGTPVGAPGGPLQLTADTTWSGNLTLMSPVVLVHPGVTLTIAAGARVQFQPGAIIQAIGTVDIQGTKKAIVHLQPLTSGDHFAGIEVPEGGTLKMAYTEQIGAGLSVNGGTVTITDSYMSRSGGDFLTINSGKVDVSYSIFGLETGKEDSHCQLHVGGSAATVSITHSNITAAVYGLMLYGGTGAILTNNNWFKNGNQIDTVPGVTADISNGWFDKGAPTAGPGATLTYTNPAAARLTDAGPR